MQTNETPLGEVGKIVGPSGQPVKSHVEQNMFNLLIHDAETDLQIAQTMRENITALRTWLGSIGNAKTRDTFKAFMDDGGQVLTVMVAQKKLILSRLMPMRDKWDEMRKKPAETAVAPESIPGEASESAPSDSSAQVAEGLEAHSALLP